MRHTPVKRIHEIPLPEEEPLFVPDWDEEGVPEQEPEKVPA